MFLILVLIVSMGNAQEQSQEQEKKELPKLEIPEITIIGKKAITLPFARKGEIYDVEVYKAPPPDTSLLIERGSFALPVLTLRRLYQLDSPWRLNAEAMFGSFGTGKLLGSVEYQREFGSIVGKGSYQTTQGHIDGASASVFHGEARVKAMLQTDNDFLKTLRASAGSKLGWEKYGLFGIQNASVKRTRNLVSVDASVGSLEKSRKNFEVTFDTDVLNITDNTGGRDSQVTAIMPQLKALYGINIHSVQLSTEVKYVSSSYESEGFTSAQSYIGLETKGKWYPTKSVSVSAGGVYAVFSDQSLFYPLGMLSWNLSTDRSLSIWWKPEFSLPTYSEFNRRNPYLVRKLNIQPQKAPLHIGTSLSLEQDDFSLSVSGSYGMFKNQDATIADSGRLWLEYVDAERSVVTINGKVRLLSLLRLNFWGALQRIHEKGGDVQLPMFPLVHMRARGEIDVVVPLALWSAVEYMSPRNVDLKGAETLSSVFLLHAGASYRVIQPLLLTLEVLNLTDTNYEMWCGYRAPGITFLLGASVVFR